MHPKTRSGIWGEGTSLLKHCFLLLTIEGMGCPMPACGPFAGYLTYPFQNQEVNSHEEGSNATNLMRECKGRELVKPALSLFWNGYAK